MLLSFYLLKLLSLTFGARGISELGVLGYPDQYDFKSLKLPDRANYIRHLVDNLDTNIYNIVKDYQEIFCCEVILIDDQDLRKDTIYSA